MTNIPHSRLHSCVCKVELIWSWTELPNVKQLGTLAASCEESNTWTWICGVKLFLNLDASQCRVQATSGGKWWLTYFMTICTSLNYLSSRFDRLVVSNHLVFEALWTSFLLHDHTWFSLKQSNLPTNALTKIILLQSTKLN
jgi:hypothetical protein